MTSIVPTARAALHAQLTTALPKATDRVVSRRPASTRPKGSGNTSYAVFLENDPPDGDPPFKATRTFNAAMAKDRVAIAKRAIRKRVLEARLADGNALHSERHFLPHVAQARGEPPEDAVELGRWSGSTAQDADLEPALRAHRCHRLRVGTLPDRYAQAAKVERVLNIITRQMDAIRAALWTRWDALPWQHGWQLVAAPPPAPTAPA
jgi:hypothetical protein